MWALLSAEGKGEMVVDSQAVKLSGCCCFSCEADSEETRSAILLLGKGLWLGVWGYYKVMSLELNI